MQITEPTTMLTDYVLAALCVYFAATLIGGANRRAGLWVAAFLVTALAAVFGGTAHGFRIPLGEHWSSLWSLTVGSIAAGSVLFIAAGVHSAMRSHGVHDGRRHDGVRWLKRGIVVTLVGLAVLVGRVSLHEHFNQNDLYHGIQMGGLYCLYRGARRLHDA